MTAPEFNNLAAGDITARLAQANLTKKTNFDDKLISLNQKINSKKTKTFTRWKKNWFKRKKIDLTQFILEEKVILKKMVHKII